MRRCLLLLLLLAAALALAACGREEAASRADGAPPAAAEPAGEAPEPGEAWAYRSEEPVDPPAEEGPEHLPTDDAAKPVGGNLPADPETPPGPARPLSEGMGA